MTLVTVRISRVRVIRVGFLDGVGWCFVTVLGFLGVVSTPSPATGYGQSPASNHPYNTPSSGYSPNMPYNPQTPGAGLDVLPMTEWHTVDIEVRAFSGVIRDWSSLLFAIRTVLSLILQICTCTLNFKLQGDVNLNSNLKFVPRIKRDFKLPVSIHMNCIVNLNFLLRLKF